jgi:hypothetical protein
VNVEAVVHALAHRGERALRPKRLAFLFERSVDIDTCDRHAEKLRRS